MFLPVPSIYKTIMGEFTFSDISKNNCSGERNKNYVRSPKDYSNIRIFMINRPGHSS